MRSLRRSSHEARFEMMPLLDVVFLLLTFFIYAMVVLVPAEVLDLQLPEFESASQAEPAPIVTISIDDAGQLFVDRELTDLEAVVPRLRDVVQADAATEVWIAADARGSADRLPVFFDLWDRLATEGFTVKLAGAATPATDPGPVPGPTPETVPSPTPDAP